MEMKCAVAKAYSSSANLGPGYDVLGLAHTAFYDRVTACIAGGGGGVEVEAVTGPYASESGGASTAVRAAEALLNISGLSRPPRILLRVEKGVPPGKGLGSSGASAAAAVAAVNALLDLQLPEEQLVLAAGIGESAAAGQPHYDNVAASLLGGLTAVTMLGGDRLRAVRIPFNIDLELAILVPWETPLKTEGKTAFMRSVLPKRVPLRDAAATLGGLALLLAAAASGDARLFGEAMMGDRLVEPVRSKYIPCYDRVKSGALRSGALGVTISGAGPSIIAVALPGGSERVAAGMMEAYRRGGCGWGEGLSVRVAPGALELVERV